MTYAKIKKEADNIRRKDGSIYVANELYTLKEAEKLGTPENFYNLVEISKKSIYWFFGARFAE